MRKNELSPLQLNKVLELRHLGANWAEIGRETKVDRRVAKREYEAWERDKKTKEQEAARFRVAAEAFHEHLKNLIRLAETFISVLEVPTLLRDLTNDDQVLEQLWQVNPNKEHVTSETQQHTNKKRERTIWRNKKLFESLQEHTHEKVQWELFEDWKQARNNAVIYSKELRTKVIELTKKTLKKDTTLTERIKTVVQCDDVTGKLSEGICENIWHSISTEETVLIEALIGCGIKAGNVWLEFYEHDTGTRLDLNNNELAINVRDLCRLIVNNLQEEPKSNIQQLYDAVHRMQNITELFEKCLDEIVLQPILLQTHCDLCPA